MFTQVLVAIDGSPTGNRGLKAAIGLATDQKAALSIVHVIDSMVGVSYVGDIGYVPAGYIDTMLDDLRTHGRKILAKAEAVARESGVDVKTVLTESKGGSIADAILGAARKVRADVIVLGTHGRRGLSRVLMGSDYPYPWQLHPVDAVFDTSFSDSEKAGILGTTAATLLNIKA